MLVMYLFLLLLFNNCNTGFIMSQKKSNPKLVELIKTVQF
jgi:hypothetical protein